MRSFSCKNKILPGQRTSSHVTLNSFEKMNTQRPITKLEYVPNAEQASSCWIVISRHVQFPLTRLGRSTTCDGSYNVFRGF